MPNGVERQPPRILVLSASVGAGHTRAAEAVELALRETAPDAFVRNLDVLETTNRAFRRLYSRAYLGLMNSAPHIHGYFYDLFDRPLTPTSPPAGLLSRADRFRIAVERLNLGRFIRLLQTEPWDLVVNTHFLPAEIIASLRRQGKLDVPQVIVTTDFDTHRMWVHTPCEHYFTATEEGRTTCNPAACRPPTCPSPAYRFIRSSARRRTGRRARPSTVFRPTGRWCCRWLAASAWWGRSSRCTRRCCGRPGRSNW